MRPVLPLLTTLAILAAGCSSEEERYLPNVVVITIDTLRPDHLGFGGNRRETAPFLAELASKGTVFDRAFSTSSWTAPATATLFTGLYPTRHGVVLGFFAHFQQQDEEKIPETMALTQLPRKVATLPEVFHEAGYTTFGLATNLNIGEELGFDRGFDAFENLGDVRAEEVLWRLEEWKTRIDDSSPYFLYLHLNDVHWPYVECQGYDPSGTDRDRYVSAYNSEISALDRVLRKIHTQLNLDDDTLIAVVSDHGEEFLDHGDWTHNFTLFRELTQVLFLVHAPGLGVPARRVDSSVSLTDVLPTLSELAGLEEVPLRNGRSLVPLLREDGPDPGFQAALEKRPIFAHRLNRLDGVDREIWSVTRGRWKLIEQGADRWIFDLLEDRLDQHPILPAGNPEVATELGELLDAFKARGTDVHGNPAVIEVDEEMLRRLTGLGYVDDQDGE
jgi:arylsulfatase A-like enzyme